MNLIKSKIRFKGNDYIVSNERPKYKEGYVHVYEDSSGVHIGTGIRLESDDNRTSHKNCMRILGTDNPGLNKEGVPSLENINY